MQSFNIPTGIKENCKEEENKHTTPTVARLNTFCRQNLHTRLNMANFAHRNGQALQRHSKRLVP